MADFDSTPAQAHQICQAFDMKLAAPRNHIEIGNMRKYFKTEAETLGDNRWRYRTIDGSVEDKSLFPRKAPNDERDACGLGEDLESDRNEVNQKFLHFQLSKTNALINIDTNPTFPTVPIPTIR